MTKKVARRILKMSKHGHGLMVMASDCGLGDWGSIPGRGKSLTPGFVFKKSSNMMVTTGRIDGCTYITRTESPDLIIKNTKYLHQKITLPKFNKG